MESYAHVCRRPCPRARENSALFQRGQPVRFERGEILWREGAPADAIYVVCTGILRVGRGGTLLELILRGAVIGEESALPGATRATRCEVLSEGRGLRLDRADLARSLQNDPSLHAPLMAIALERSQRLAERLDELVEGSVEQRLARGLLRLAEEMSLPDARGAFLPIRLSCGDWGRMVRCRPETVTRHFTRWRSAGVLETAREGTILRDVAALRRAAGWPVAPLRLVAG